MLSSKDIRELVVSREKPDYEDVRKNFQERNWKAVGNKIIIDPYKQENVTPFSYDLSVGKKLLSLRNHDRGEVGLPYDMKPGEAVAIITEEFVALPPCYAATIWPRFGFVLEGVFQSMVKIDPTWYGNLSVVVANLSPRTFRIESGFRFGTLVLYGLTKESDTDLWSLSDLRSKDATIASVKLVGLPALDAISKKLDDFKGRAWIEGSELRVSGLKSDEYEKLKDVDPNRIWTHAVQEVCDKWRQTRGPANRRIEPSAALGMTDLQDIARKTPKGRPVDLDTAQVNAVALQNAAKEYGHPFELLHGLPKMIHDETSRTVKDEISSEVGRRVYPDVVTLVFRIVGALSLVVAVIGLLIKFFLTSDLKAEVVISVALVIVAIAASVGLVKLPWRSIGGKQDLKGAGCKPATNTNGK
jgi:deoxycytidine triphosphate deaminase